MKRAGTKTLGVGLFLSALSSCNGLTGIYDLSPGVGLGGSGDDIASGGKPRGMGGTVAAGGQKASGGARSSGGAREGGGGTQDEGSGGAPKGSGGAQDGAGGSGGGEPEAAGGMPGVGGSAPSGGAENVGGSSGGQHSTGGSSGGAPAGGAPSGGASSGGAPSGGASSGGAESAGGTGGWGGHSTGALPLLDDFSEPLNGRWKSPFGFRVEEGVLTCEQCESAILWNETFSLPQAAEVRLSSKSTEAEEMNLVLLASSGTCKHIEITYNIHGYLGVATCQGDNGWQTWGGVYRVVAEGGTIGARVWAGAEPGEVAVEVLVNGVVVYEVTVPFPYTSGSIGISGKCTAPACVTPPRFDDFRGGELIELREMTHAQ